MRSISFGGCLQAQCFLTWLYWWIQISFNPVNVSFLPLDEERRCSICGLVVFGSLCYTAPYQTQQSESVQCFSLLSCHQYSRCLFDCSFFNWIAHGLFKGITWCLGCIGSRSWILMVGATLAVIWSHNYRSTDYQHLLLCMRLVSIALSFTRSVRSYTTMSASPPSSRMQPKWHKPKDISSERPVLKLYNSLTKSKVTNSFNKHMSIDLRVAVDWICTQTTWPYRLVQLWPYCLWRCSYGSC